MPEFVQFHHDYALARLGLRARCVRCGMSSDPSQDRRGRNTELLGDGIHRQAQCKTPLKELTRSRKFQQPALANLWKSIGKSFLRKRMAGHMALMPRAVTR